MSNNFLILLHNKSCAFDLISYYANISYFATPNSTNHFIGVFLLIWNCLNLVIHPEIFSLDQSPLFYQELHPKCCLYLYLFRGIYLFIALIIQIFQIISNVVIFDNNYSSLVGIPIISSVYVTILTIVSFVNHILLLRPLHRIVEPRWTASLRHIMLQMMEEFVMNFWVYMWNYFTSFVVNQI